MAEELAPVRFKLNRDSPFPLYYQLMEIIRSYIEKMGLEPGDKLPSERELVQHFGISRMTMRQAINELVNEGLLVRSRGLGTFLKPQKVVRGLSTLTSFTGDTHRRGFAASSKILE